MPIAYKQVHTHIIYLLSSLPSIEEFSYDSSCPGGLGDVLDSPILLPGHPASVVALDHNSGIPDVVVISPCLDVHNLTKSEIFTIEAMTIRSPRSISGVWQWLSVLSSTAETAKNKPI